MQRIPTPKPKLEVHDLELVLAIASAGSTAKASATLHITQSAVSRGLLSVEEKLGLSLFDRTPRGLSPTTAGKRLIHGAVPALTCLTDLEASLAGSDRETVRLRVACECYTAYRWLPSTLAELRRTTPNLDVELMPEHSRAPVAALRVGAIDVAFLTTGIVRKPIIEAPLFADEVVFVVSTRHPLAARKAITARDLDETPLIASSQTPSPERRWFSDKAFGRRPPNAAPILFPLTEAIIDATRAGMGIAVLSEWIAGPYLETGDLVVKRLSGRPLFRNWRIAFRRERADAARRLAAALAHAPPKIYPRPLLIRQA